MASWKYCSQFDLWIYSGNMLKVALLDASIVRRFCPIARYESECLLGERPRAWDLFLTSDRSRSLEVRI